jgi:hypothetical protein
MWYTVSRKNRERVPKFSRRQQRLDFEFFRRSLNQLRLNRGILMGADFVVQSNDPRP